MGIKTSAVAALVADANASLSMDGSSSQEGRVTLAPADPNYAVQIPIPAGVDTMQTIRFEAHMVSSDGGGILALNWNQALRINGGGLAGGARQDINGRTFTINLNTFEYTLESDGLAPRTWAWRWTLSPVYPAMFPIPAG